MGDKTGIEWTATVNADGSVTPGATWNPVTGCSKVSPGCAHCYAEAVALRFWAKQYPPVPVAGADNLGVEVTRPREFTDVLCHEDRIDQPLRWKRPRKVFVNSMSDLFHEDVPDQFITDVFGIMALAHWHTFQILTKRPQRALDYLSRGDHGVVAQFQAIQQRGGIALKSVFAALDIKRRDGIGWSWPLPNVWLGVSCENQRDHATLRARSTSPMPSERNGFETAGREVITEHGECFTKHPRISDRKGGDITEWPEDLRVREFPAVPA